MNQPPPWDPHGQQPYPGEQYGSSGQQSPQDSRQPPPGWYPDPGGQQALRWWDGTAWAPHTQPLPDQQPSADPYGASPDPARQLPAGHRSPRRGGGTHRVRNILAVIGALVVAGAIIIFLSSGSTAPPVTGHGSLTVYLNPFSGLNMQDAYPDITSGGQVTVTDPSGKVIGTGTLSYSKKDTVLFLMEAAAKYPQIASSLANDVVIYTFTVAVPGGEQRYGFSVGKNRGTIWVPSSQVKDPGLTLGSLSG